MDLRRRRKQTSPQNYPRIIASTDVVDNWKQIWAKGIILGGKILPTHYIGALLQKLAKYQLNKMIEYHFHHCSSDNKDEAVKMSIDQRLAQMLTWRDIRKGTTLASVDLVHRSNRFGLLYLHNRNSDEQKIQQQKSEREVAKLFEWTEETWSQSPKDFPMKDSGFQNLTSTDVHFIVSCFIDMEYDRKELIAKINGINSTEPASQFPTSFPNEDDDFSSFDPVQLRGTLADTVLSKKLKGYALGLQEIKIGAFATIAPLALVDIVASYYPIDIN